MSVGALFPDAASPAYGFNNGYVSATTLSVGKGYWLKFNSAKTYTISGSAVRPTNIAVNAGWNIIGPFDFDFATSSITSTPSGIVVSPYYGYSNGYTTATMLGIGKGYWVKVSQGGTLSLQAPNSSIVGGLGIASKEASAGVVTIAVEDNAGHRGVLYLAEGRMGDELPPVPPQGVFDVRFGSNVNIEAIGSGEHEILLSSVEYPVRVTLRGINGRELRMKDGLGGMLINERIEEGRGVTIRQNVSKIILSESGETNGVVAKYELSQNYPNPFNPSTVIRYTLTEGGYVRMSVHNVLGEKVADLVNGVKGAGTHEVTFSAVNIPSGVYYYRLEVMGAVLTKQLMIVK
jgi:hypothetical protein